MNFYMKMTEKVENLSLQKSIQFRIIMMVIKCLMMLFHLCTLAEFVGIDKILIAAADR